jgi:ABC-type dipeptide/oligopeptide/nickel transport system permease component
MIVRYSLQRLLMLIPVSISISIVIFLIVHMLPGDPIDNLIRTCCLGTRSTISSGLGRHRKIAPRWQPNTV